MFESISITFTTTEGALDFVAHLCPTSILGMFGPAATSVEALATLQASQRVVETIKARHERS